MNSIAQTKEDERNNRWNSWTTWMSIPYDGSRPYTITFRIKNTNNRHDYSYRVYENGNAVWHKGDIYWGFYLNVRNRNGATDEFGKYYSNKKRQNIYNGYTSEYDTDNKYWYKLYPSEEREEREVKIVVTNTEVNVYVSGKSAPIKTFKNANGVSYIGAVVGTAANVVVTDFKILRQTNYAAAKPKIAEAAQALVNQNYSAAASIATNIIDNLHKSAEVYMLRAGAYVGMGYFKTAIEDYTRAINFSSNDNDEEAYYMRGLCKFHLEDRSCVDDFRRGGQQGRVFLNEHDWLTKPQPQTQSRQPARPAQPQKPQLQKQGSGGSSPSGSGGTKGALTKDPNFKKK